MTLGVRLIPTLFMHFYMFKQLKGWWYITSRTKKKMFGKLAKLVKDWKAKYVVVSYPDGFNIPMFGHDLIHNKVERLLENNFMSLEIFYISMNKRSWCDLDMQEIVTKYPDGKPIFDMPIEQDATYTSFNHTQPCHERGLTSELFREGASFV